MGVVLKDLQKELPTSKAIPERVFSTVGAHRIFLECESRYCSPELREERIKKYEHLVDALAIAGNSLGIKPYEEERFITEVWGMLYGNLKISYKVRIS